MNSQVLAGAAGIACSAAGLHITPASNSISIFKRMPRTTPLITKVADRKKRDAIRELKM